jgi:immune inhibitor A
MDQFVPATEGRLWMLGCFDIMASGSSWGCGAGPSEQARTPKLFSPWSRERAGWLAPQNVGSVTNQEFVLRPAAMDGNVLRVPVRQGDLSEYYYIEYRQRLGFDTKLPGDGVLIYHVDTMRKVQTCPITGTTPCRHFRVRLVEADGRADLLRTGAEGGNRGEASDLFGGSGPRQFSASTIPAARARDGSASTLVIHDIVINAATREARVRLSTAPGGVSSTR